jgi:hypothetical protein
VSRDHIAQEKAGGNYDVASRFRLRSDSYSGMRLDVTGDALPHGRASALKRPYRQKPDREGGRMQSQSISPARDAQRHLLRVAELCTNAATSRLSCASERRSMYIM